MNKKILIVAALFMIVCVTGAFSWGIGVQGGWNMGIPGNAALTFKVDPWAFAGNFYIGDHLFGVGIAADYWLVNNNIVGPLNWFLGVGGGFIVRLYDDDYKWTPKEIENKQNKHTHFGLSARLPIGLNLMLPVGPVEIEPYVQLVPMLGLQVVPDFHPDFDFDANIGIRFHF